MAAKVEFPLVQYETLIKSVHRRRRNEARERCFGGMCSADADDAQRIKEMRSAPRKRQLKQAKLIVDELSLVIDCRLRDLSLTGAGIECHTALAIPDNVRLKVGDGQPQHAQVVWRAGGRFGLKFRVSDQLAELLAARTQLHGQFEGPLRTFLKLAREAQVGSHDPAAAINSQEVRDELGRIYDLGDDLLTRFNYVTDDDSSQR